MQRRRLLQYRHVYNELAYNLAWTAIDVTRAHVATAVRTPGSAIFKSLTASPTDLFGSSADRVILETIDLLKDYRPIVERTVEGLEGAKDLVSTVRVHVFVRPEQTFSFAAPKAGNHPLSWDRERQGRLFLEALAVLKAGLFSVESRLTGFHEFRALSPALPVVSDFTLFAGEPVHQGQPRKLNAVAGDHQGVPTNGRVPLVLNNGEARPRKDWAGALDQKVLAKQGWVYLGGEDDQVLNLAFATKEDELSGSAAPSSVGEDFALFHGDPARPVALRTYVDPAANRAVTDGVWEIRSWDMGVPGSLSGAYLPALAPAFDQVDPDTLRSSVLRLLGRPGAISPTLVFGRVLSGLLRVAAAAPRGKTGTAAKTCFCILKGVPAGSDLAGFYHELAALIPQGETKLPEVLLTGVQGQLKSGKFLFMNESDLTLRAVDSPRISATAYQEIQSGARARPYNQNLLFLASKNEDPLPLDHGATLGLPRSLFTTDGAGTAPPASEGPHTVPASVWPQPVAARGSLDLRLVAQAMSDSRFVNDKASRLVDPGRYPTLADFLRGEGMLRDGKLDLGGFVEATGKVTIPASITIVRGGAILADEIAVEGEIAAAAPDALLLLVARTGTIRLPEAAKVAALAVAPRGSVQLDRRADVTGQIVARTLDLDRAQEDDQPARLAYQPALKFGASTADGARRMVIDLRRSFTQVW